MEESLNKNSLEGKELLGKRILVADDEEYLRDPIAFYFEDEGCIVESVENGKLLLEKLETGKFDAVISDNNMPEMNGVEALRHIRSDSRFKDLPVIIQTGLGDDNLKKDIEELGGIYLTKPCAPKEIGEKLKGCFKETAK